MCVCVFMRVCMHLLVEHGHHGDLLQSFKWQKWAVGSNNVWLSCYTITQSHICFSTLQSFLFSIQISLLNPFIWVSLQGAVWSSAGAIWALHRAKDGMDDPNLLAFNSGYGKCSSLFAISHGKASSRLTRTPLTGNYRNVCKLIKKKKTKKHHMNIKLDIKDTKGLLRVTQRSGLVA